MAFPSHRASENSGVITVGAPSGSQAGGPTVKDLPGMRETRVQSQGQEDPPEKKWPRIPVYSCPENPMD